ncbi:flagellar biosynthesis protein FlhF [Aquabacterium sp. J223]|uniref:flagellar biosynthesis protein FlhF n=1 Tax=Aquabacterium sp. J223 TaxID=2898431 RepID=UPI0021AE108A|nr:flagellar biosynthesis protein FlhF [Aquabacterium sp. J223]UUX94854.1 flagellar biosynthesis protein FlhF [Aquabacterium sp. J223]
MNVKRFTGRTSRDALNLVRQAFGDEAVVLSTKPCADGVEVLAMAPDGLQQIERVAASAPVVNAPAAQPATAEEERHVAPPRRSAAAALKAVITRPRQPATEQPVETDVEQLAMSTLSFQDYVRERMLRRRRAEMAGVDDGRTAAESAFDARLEDRPALPRSRTERQEPRFDDAPLPTTARVEPRFEPATAAPVASAFDEFLDEQALLEADAAHAAPRRAETAAAPARRPVPPARPQPLRQPPVLRDEIAAAAQAAPVQPAPAVAPAAQAETRRDAAQMLHELRSMKGLIEERFGALAFMEKLQRHPAQARLTQKLLDDGFSPGLVRKLAESLPMDAPDEAAWAAGVLARNLVAGEQEPALEDQGGVYALIGSTGVGKTTSTAKLAAAFATKFGAANLGLITLDAYRVGAHEQLRAYGRILGVPVHTAHDRASLEDLLELLSAKRMVLIDTAGMAQRDSRTRELLDMLAHRSIQKVLVLNAAAQGETLEDVILAWGAAQCRGVVLSKLDEAVKLAPAVDALLRHKLKVLAVANGQRVPEDWHRLSAQALVHRALKAQPGAAWRMDASDVNLIFARHTGAHAAGARA